jgi:hypothetical protein
MHDEVWEKGTGLAKAIQAVTDKQWNPSIFCDVSAPYVDGSGR